MEYSHNGTVLMALPLVILVLALVIALYQTGFDLEAATLPENPVGPLEETLMDLMETDQPLVSGSAVEYDPATDTITLTGSVANPTAYPLMVTNLEYRIEVGENVVVASLPDPVTVPPQGETPVVLSGEASPGAATALKSGTMDGALSLSLEVMGIGIMTDVVRPWEVGA